MAHKVHIESRSCKNPDCNHVIPAHPGRGRSVFCSQECRESYPDDLRKAELNARQYLTRRKALYTGLAGVSTLRYFTYLHEVTTRKARYERAWQELHRIRRELVEIPRPYPEVAEEAKSIAISVKHLINSEKGKGLEAAYLWNTANQILLEAGEQGDVNQALKTLRKRAASVKHFWKGQKKSFEYAKALIVEASIHYRQAEFNSESAKKKEHLTYTISALNEAIEIIENTNFGEAKEKAHNLLCLAILWQFKLFAFPLNNEEQAEIYLERFEELSYDTDSPWVKLQLHSQTAGFIRLFKGEIERARDFVDAAFDEYRLFGFRSPMVEVTPLRAKIETLVTQPNPDVEEIKTCIKEYTNLVYAYPLLFSIKTAIDFTSRFQEFNFNDINFPKYAFTYETTVASWTSMFDVFTENDS